MADKTSKRFRRPAHWKLPQILSHYSKQGRDGCLLWTGSKQGAGYGTIGWRGKILQAHRVAWEEARGTIPAGLHVLHRCDVRACINVEHLFLGTNADNVADRVAKGRDGRPCGENNGWAKLTDKDAMAIFLATGRQSDIGARYGVNHRTVSLIKRKERWRHIHGPAPTAPKA